MLYLEDYLEMIEHLPQHFRDTLTQMRELDLQVHNDMDNWQIRVNKFFTNAHFMAQESRDAQFEQIKQEYQKALEAAEEKVTTAGHLYELVDKYLRKLEQELLKFKMELEADNAGITEILEKRSLELDNPPSANHLRDKRKLGLSIQNDNRQNSVSLDFAQSNYNAIQNNYGKHQNCLQQSAQSNSMENPFAYFNSKLASEKNLSQGQKVKVNLSNNSAIVAAASQAIAATQQTMQMGRRTASLKASYDAINTGFANFNFHPIQIESDPNVDNSFLRQVNELNDFDNSNKKSRPNKRSRTSSQYNSEINDSSSFVSMNTDASKNEDKLEIYCICNGFSYGDMICCENITCKYNQWFHYGCVGIKQPPKGSWYCKDCSLIIKEQKKKKEKLRQVDQ